MDEIKCLLDGEPRRVALDELTDEFGEDAIRDDIAAVVQERVMYLHDNRDALQASSEQPDSETITDALVED